MIESAFPARNGQLLLYHIGFCGICHTGQDMQ